MRYNWLQQEATRKLLDIYWDKGENNDAYYSTNNFSPAHHKAKRPKYILKGFSVSRFFTNHQNLFGEGVLKPYPARK